MPVTYVIYDRMHSQTLLFHCCTYFVLLYSMFSTVSSKRNKLHTKKGSRILTSTSRGSSDSIVTRLRAGQLGLECRQGQGYFLRHCVQTDSGANIDSYTMGNRGLLSRW